MIYKHITLMIGGLPEALKEKYNGLFPSWVTIVATILAFTILLLVMTKLVWKPVKKMVSDRRAHIQSNIDSATSQNKEAADNKEKANQELISARVEAAEIINEAKVSAEQLKRDSEIKAKENSNKILADAKQEIESEKIRLAKETKQEIVEVALAAAKKIVEKEVDNKTNRKLVEKFIKS